MEVREIMNAPAHTCRASATLDEAVAVMDEHDIGSVLITDVEGHAVGIITDRDACLAAHRQGRPMSDIFLRDVMSPSAIACRPDEDAASALRVMKDNSVRRVAVIDERGRPAGLLSIDDVAEAVDRAGSEDLDGVSMRDVVAVLGTVIRHEHEERPLAERPTA